MYSLQCEICGSKSGAIEDYRSPTAREQQMMREFRLEHIPCLENMVGFSQDDVVALRPEDWRPLQVGAFGSPKADPVSVPKPHGHGHYTGPYGEEQEVDMISCCHCRGFVEARQGNLEKGGFCALCYNGEPNSGWTCGSDRCQLHVPYEVQLDNADAGRPLLTPPFPLVVSGFDGAVLLEPPPPVVAGIFL